jgi:hypothetical protein
MKTQNFISTFLLMVFFLTTHAQSFMHGISDPNKRYFDKNRSLVHMPGFANHGHKTTINDSIWLRGKEEMFFFEDGELVPFDFYTIIEYYDHIPDYNKPMNVFMVQPVTNDSLGFVHYTYDSLKRRTLETWYDYDTLNMQWKYTSRTFHHFDMLNNDTLWISQLWDNLNKNWINNYRRFRRIHQDIGAFTEDYYEHWNEGEWKIVQGNKFTYYLSGYNCTDSIDIIQWNNNINSWETKHKWYMYYDENNVQTWGRDMIFDNQINAWRNYQQTLDYEYNNWPGCENIWINGTEPTHFIIQNWYDDEWVNVERANITYDELGGNISILESYHNDHWINWSKNIISYLDIGVLDYFLLSEWKDSTWFPFYGSKYEYSYDGSKLTEMLDYTMDTTGDWKEKRLFKYSNFRLFLNTEENDALNSKNIGLKIFPNPGKKEVFVEIGNGEKIMAIKVFSPAGHSIFNKTYAHKQTIRAKLNISSFPKGAYVVEAVAPDNTRHNGKLIVK